MVEPWFGTERASDCAGDEMGPGTLCKHRRDLPGESRRMFVLFRCATRGGRGGGIAHEAGFMANEVSRCSIWAGAGIRR